MRDRTLFLLDFALGWRRSELSVLDLADVSFSKSRGATFYLAHSKMDQVGEGRIVSVLYGASNACPIRQLERWLEVRGRWRGPLFCRLSSSGNLQRKRLGAASICVLIQAQLTSLGVDAGAYGAHSLRAGMGTAGAENGASEIAIMQRGGWKNIATVLRYVRPAQGFRVDPLAGHL